MKYGKHWKSFAKAGSLNDSLMRKGGAITLFDILPAFLITLKDDCKVSESIKSQPKATLLNPKTMQWMLASAFSSGTKYYWKWVIGGQQCYCSKYGSSQGQLVEEMTLDVSDGPAYSGLVSWSHRRLDLCLKRPSFYCLIPFYKRCVSYGSHRLMWFIMG